FRDLGISHFSRISCLTVVGQVSALRSHVQVGVQVAMALAYNLLIILMKMEYLAERGGFEPPIGL
ncbi:MAG TPA: hypothetical protein VJV39_12545, partial [Dongiaceae bacterium]|nr:hypothetical protein [Dongiaceae bacterium]